MRYLAWGTTCHERCMCLLRAAPSAGAGKHDAPLVGLVEGGGNVLHKVASAALSKEKARAER